jgi:hypothetical protein
VWITVADGRISDAHLARRLEAEPAVVVRVAEEHGHGPAHIVCTPQQFSHQLFPDASAVTSRRHSKWCDRYDAGLTEVPPSRENVADDRVAIDCNEIDRVN